MPGARQLIEWSQDFRSPEIPFPRSRSILAPVEVYAFTAQSRVLEFVRGATPVDFAYPCTPSRHQCVGAKVNGRWFRCVTRSTPATSWNSDAKGHHPAAMAEFREASHAKSKIRHWINEQEREEAKDMGRSCSKSKRGTSGGA